jgi:hypothetical protein
MTRKLEKVLPIVILFFGLLILFTIFFDSLVNNNGEVLMSGITATFGGNPYQFGVYFDHTIHFSIYNFIAYVLPAFLSMVFIRMVINTKRTSVPKQFLGLLLTLTFIVSLVLFFQLPANTTHTTNILGVDVNGNFSSLNLAIGPILGYVFSILGTISSIVYTILQFEK